MMECQLQKREERANNSWMKIIVPNGVLVNPKDHLNHQWKVVT